MKSPTTSSSSSSSSITPYLLFHSALLAIELSVVVAVRRLHLLQSNNASSDTKKQQEYDHNLENETTKMSHANRRDMVYYDPFNADEEEDYLATEKLRIAQAVDRFVDGLLPTLSLSSSSSLSTSVTPVFPTITSSSPSSSSSSSSSSMDCVLHFPLQYQQLVRIVDAISSLNGAGTNGKLQKLSFQHWGLGNRGVEEIVRLWMVPPATEAEEESRSNTTVIIQELALTGCGITSAGLQVLLESLVSNGSSPSLGSLDLRRNNFRYDPDTVARLFRMYLPRLSPKLQRLNLASTGLTPSAIQAVLEGVFTVSSPIQQLDISNNLESLYDLLTIVVQSLERVSAARHQKQRQSQTTVAKDDHHPYSASSQLRRLILVNENWNSSSRCLDYREESHVALLEQLANMLLLSGRTDADGSHVSSIVRNLTVLGPLAVIPLDPSVTDPTLLQRHERCVTAIERIQFTLQVNACRPTMEHILMERNATLLPLAWATAETKWSSTPIHQSTMLKSSENSNVGTSTLSSLSSTFGLVSNPKSKSILPSPQPASPSLLYYWIRETECLMMGPHQAKKR